MAKDALSPAGIAQDARLVARCHELRGVAREARIHARRSLRFRSPSRRSLSGKPERQAEDTAATPVSARPRVHRFRFQGKLSIAILGASHGLVSQFLP